ncbi:hypothetical protein BM1_00031 [Bipolaris maydis]|nr:hypothetical protein BM1_00031 [Bipolaris maydis]
MVMVVVSELTKMIAPLPRLKMFMLGDIKTIKMHSVSTIDLAQNVKSGHRTKSSLASTVCKKP